jgi:hypothetical protein
MALTKIIKFNGRLIIILLGLWLGGCANDNSNNVVPGTYFEKPPGIADIKGECVGDIALTPTQIVQGSFQQSYLLVYHCAKKSFEILPTAEPLHAPYALRDLTVTKNGYYFARYLVVEDSQVAAYFFMDKQGQLLKKFAPDDVDSHDVIVDDQTISYAMHVPERDAASCNEYPVVNLELREETPSGEAKWAWTSKGKFFQEWDIPDEQPKAMVGSGKKTDETWVQLRHCVTAMVNKIIKIQTPAVFIFPGPAPLFHFREYDFIHPNSMQYINQDKDILISARHFDTIFIINRETGGIPWALGGIKSKATDNYPVDDPKHGFSHQHSAYIKNNILYIFDNGNAFPGRPSRVVTYSVDPAHTKEARFLFDFDEPNGVQRLAMGWVRPLDDHRLIVGWGAVNGEAVKKPQRAVSIVNMTTKKEEFSMDFAPGWFSYRAKLASTSQEGANQQSP